MAEIRDSKGSLAAFSLPEDARTALEVFLSRQQEHNDRVDSNISDLKHGQATQMENIKKLTNEVSESMWVFRDALSRLRELGQKNIALSTICADYTNEKLAREANWKMIKMVGTWIGGLLLLLGTFFGYEAIKK